MIDLLLNILKLQIVILPFLLLCLHGKKVNLEKSLRSKQFPMPAIALLYSVVVMIFSNKLIEFLIGLFYRVVDWMTDLRFPSWVPDEAQDVLYSVIDKILKFLHTINPVFWIFLISNLVILLAYYIFKRICLSIINLAVKTDGKLHKRISEIFYEYFPEKDKWCLKDDYSQVRDFFRVFYYAAIIISTVLTVVSSQLYARELIRSVFSPVYGIIIVSEFYFLLDGFTKREYTSDILGEDDDAYKNVNYSLLRNLLRGLFGDKLLAENTSLNNALTYDVTTEEILTDLSKSEDPKIISFAAFFDSLNKRGVKIDHNYLHSSLDMMCGKSILFNNPFYNDLIPYAFYPMNRQLLQHKKVLVILGRHSVEDDMIEWLENGVASVTNIPYFWKIGLLGKEADDEDEPDIGIITRSNVLDVELINANADFFEKVGFIYIIEPSKLLSTAQIGLNLIVKSCRAGEDREIVYCMCDKNCDGLVDAMSHALLTSITEVSATKKHLGTSSYMCWEADGEYLHHRLMPNISRYLGIGTELSFAALKNQVSKTKWFGGDAFPVTDIRWIDKQYYYDLTKYANMTTSPDAIDERFITSPNFWSACEEENNYFTVEDESNNMFEILREFSTRSNEQGFINVISQEYLLKDYMADNSSIFEADAKAIPYIVADYTRSNRNTTLRLILMISTSPVCEDIIEKEFSLLGIKLFDLKKQLWYELYKCYAAINETDGSDDGDYRSAVEAVYAEPINVGGVEFTNDIIVSGTSFNLKKGALETVYSIKDKMFHSVCVSELRSAGYIAEDEKGEKNYLGSELRGHIYQKYLPGQFFTFGGKYYEMQYLTADGHVLIRRAGDHINGRPSYRQVRRYTLNGIRPSDKIGSQRNIAGLRVAHEFADITVETPGYYDMKRYSDFSTARYVSFEGEKTGIPQRVYRRKEILRIELPESEEGLSDNIRYTVTLLFNEVFRTIFAENQAYICAVTYGQTGDGTQPSPLTYSIDGDDELISKKAIYIIEDSQLDLGLTVAVERNLERIFGIMHDYLEWNFDAIAESLDPPQEPVDPVSFSDEPQDDETGKKKKGIIGFFCAIGRWFKKLFKKIVEFFKKLFKRKKKDVGAGESADTPEEEDGTGEGNTPGNTDSETGDGTAEDSTDNGEEKGESDRKKKRREKKERKKREKEERKRRKRDKKKGGAGNGAVSDEGVPGDTGEGEDGGDDFAPINENEVEITPEGEVKPEGVDEPDGEAASEDGTSDDGETEYTEQPGYERGNDAEEEKKQTTETVEAPAGDIPVQAPDEPAQSLPFEREPYHRRYYMLYGYENELPFLDLTGTLDLLSGMGMDDNALRRARLGIDTAELIESAMGASRSDIRRCDFCGAEITGVEFETLADGRDRCLNCGKTAVKTADEFRRIFSDVKRNLESFFNISINVGIKVEMVNSRTLHKQIGHAYVPTPDMDGRVLGVAISGKNGYRLLIENGSPRMASMLTIAHELTHIWQYTNWNDKMIRKKYGKQMRLEIYEGMAKWVEIQYAYLINEPTVAKREELLTSYRDDEYGHGFLRYRANYPFSCGTVITKATPFMNREMPLAPDYCGAITVQLPTVPQIPAQQQRKRKRRPAPEKTGRRTRSVKGPSERTPGSVPGYAYGLLGEKEKAVYDTFLDAILNFKEEVGGFTDPLTEADASRIIDYVTRDHPEIFWFRQGATFYMNAETCEVVRITFTYCMSKEETEKRRSEIDASLRPFLESVNDGMSDFEIALRVYENIIDLVDYDTLGLERQKKEPQSASEPDDLRSVYGVFVNKKAVCAGYAKATQYLLNRLGIECTYVTSDTHAWNLIKLEGDYYHLDTTWGDSSDTDKTKNGNEYISYDCFCITTEEVLRLKSHTPTDAMPLPECTATKCNYYVRHGLYFERFDFARIRDIVCGCIDSGELNAAFKFASKQAFDEARAALVDRGQFRDIIQFSNLSSGVKIDGTYLYSANEERLTLSFYMKLL